MDLERSDRKKSALLVFAMAPFLGVSIFFFVIAATHLVTLRRIAAHTPSAEAGPAVLSGKVSRPRGLVRAPSGKLAAGWAAWIALDDNSSGRLRFNILCRRADLSDLDLASAGERAPLDLVRPGDALDVTFGNRLDLTFLSSGVIVHLGTLADGLSGGVSEIPAEMRLACGHLLAGVNPSQLIYNERLLEEGQQVEILACRRDGRVVPCGDGVDAITTQSINRGQRIFSTVLFIGEIWTLVFVATMGFSAVAQVVRIRRAGR
jgi:hypothetical protein